MWSLLQFPSSGFLGTEVRKGFVDKAMILGMLQLDIIKLTSKKGTSD